MSFVVSIYNNKKLKELFEISQKISLDWVIGYLMLDLLVIICRAVRGDECSLFFLLLL